LQVRQLRPARTVDAARGRFGFAHVSHVISGPVRSTLGFAP